MIPRISRLLFATIPIVTVVGLLPRPARAWGPDGHHTVATIADKLIAGTNAAAQVAAILGSTSLVDAAVWADCAKGVDPSSLTYKGAGTYPECAPFETPAGEAAMVDFVKRNSTNCPIKAGEEICHKQYHYSDIAIQHPDYESKFRGARPDDVESAITAAISVLQDKAAPAPFSIKDKREALLLLTHYVGDIHQPLHVGAIYLDPTGKPVNPDRGQYDPNSETTGGNDINVTDSEANLHATWDLIPETLKADKVDSEWLSLAKRVPVTGGQITQWSVVWATDTQKQAQKAFHGLRFSAKSGKTWTTTLAASYSGPMATTKKTQLTKGGARLAQVLRAIWPDLTSSKPENHPKPTKTSDTKP
jgi:hypothetical protein